MYAFMFSVYRNTIFPFAFAITRVVRWQSCTVYGPPCFIPVSCAAL